MTEITLTQEQYDAIVKLICPYCSYGIPDIRVEGRWEHRAQNIGIDYHVCLATNFRGKIKIA